MTRGRTHVCACTPQDIRTAALEASPLASHALAQFWDRGATTSVLTGAADATDALSFGPLPQQLQQQQQGRRRGPSAGGGPAGAQAAPLPALSSPSRYLSDFVEEQRLGKGGFGVVVKATNRCVRPGARPA